MSEGVLIGIVIFSSIFCYELKTVLLKQKGVDSPREVQKKSIDVFDSVNPNQKRQIVYFVVRVASRVFLSVRNLNFDQRDCQGKKKRIYVTDLVSVLMRRPYILYINIYIYTILSI